MLRRMQTIDRNDLVSAAFEACPEFAGAGDASPVCAGCGWLESEHERDADLHTLPARHPAPTLKRLAS
jgi:hypothetical protein